MTVLRLPTVLRWLSGGLSAAAEGHQQCCGCLLCFTVATSMLHFLRCAEGKHCWHGSVAASHLPALQTRSNALAWNPMEAFNFTVANEDCCLYTYDMRRLDSAACVHQDFVSAVMDVDYSPTGREFVAGGYDR